MSNNKDSNIAEINKIIGITYIVTSLSSIFFQIFTFCIFYKKQFLLKNTAYKLILLLTFFEFLQQIPHFSSGVSSIMNKSIPTILERFLGSLLQTSFMLAILTTLFLTLNRFYIFYENILIKFIIYSFVKNITIFITIALGISLFITYLFHEYGLEYNIHSRSWNYIMDQDDPIPIYEFEYLYTLIILSICFIFYIIIFIRITNNRIIVDKTNNKLFKCSDIRILIHIIFIFLFNTILEIFWWYLPNWFEGFDLSGAILNYAWIIYSGMNTLLNIIFISQINEEFKKIFTCQSDHIFSNCCKNQCKFLNTSNVKNITIKI